MEITSVRFRRVGGDGRVRASASICFDGQFVVHGLKVIDGPNGLFVSMPARRTGSGEYRDTAHPVTAETREMIQESVLHSYEEWVEERGISEEDGSVAATA